MPSKSPASPLLPTVGVIAEQTGRKVHQVAYAVRVLGLTPVARAGVLRIFSDEDVGRIKAHLDAMGTNRSTSGETGRD